MKKFIFTLILMSASLILSPAHGGELRGSPAENLQELCQSWKGTTQHGILHHTRDWIAMWDSNTVYSKIASGLLYPEVWDAFWNPTYGIQAFREHGWMSPRLARLLRLHEFAMQQELNKCLPGNPALQKQFMEDLEDVAFRAMFYVVASNVAALINLARLGPWILLRGGYGSWQILRYAFTYARANFGQKAFWQLVVIGAGKVASSTALTQLFYPFAQAFNEKVKRGDINLEETVGKSIDQFNEKTTSKSPSVAGLEYLLGKVKKGSEGLKDQLGHKIELSLVETRGALALTTNGSIIEFSDKELQFIRSEAQRHRLQ